MPVKMESLPHWYRDIEAKNVENPTLEEQTLYITVFDHKERTTRIYTQDNEMDIFYSTKSDAPLVESLMSDTSFLKGPPQNTR